MMERGSKDRGVESKRADIIVRIERRRSGNDQMIDEEIRMERRRREEDS